ncbi:MULTISPECIES: crotonase/enoyl-CoA hydratase family protein [unclassified Yoonia]|uniref:crotonase/enoyl-CoA hydratase family protein n=1 Tax=unclassified Yoonia TaxID=2629118 RepID=UPI002AFE9E48|nr:MULTISPECIES: crotonase/enoyl-CoA hydratase family protein [unclassified Yoonia]
MDGQMNQLVTYELRGEIALIGLNRPAKRNAISDRFVETLHDAVEQAQREAKAAVIFGEGQHFCAGLDLAEHVEKPLIAAVQGSRRWHRVFDGIERGEIPFIVALQGAVVGGGFELAAAAHIRVADETAFFGLPEGTRGIFVGGGGSVRIARLIGAQRMGDMMLTGRTVSPQQMEQWGGVSYVVPAGDALTKAIALAQAAAQNAPMSNYAIINALPRIRDMSSEDGLFVESLMSSLTSATPEATERLRAFLEKRTAKLAAPKD